MGIKLYILDNGYLECDKNWMVATSSVGTRRDRNCPSVWIQIPTYSVLVDHPQGRFLFDLGCPANAKDGYWPPKLYDLFPYYYEDRQTLPSQLGLIGLKPADVPVIIASHLHMDHVGNLSLFGHAEVYTHRREFESAQSIVRQDPDPEKHGA